jgi:hypothetical protein
MHAYAMFQAQITINESLEAAARERMFRNARSHRSFPERLTTAAARLWAALTTPVAADPDGGLPRLEGYPYRP